MKRLDRSSRAGIAAAWIVVVAALLVSVVGKAHEAHRKPARPGADSTAPAEGTAGATRHGSGSGVRPPTKPKEPPFDMPPMGDMVVHHLHNKVIHLPIVLAPVALVLFLADRRRPGTGDVAPLFVWGAALSSVAAFFSGRAQAGAFDDGPKEWLVATHQKWGVAVMIALLVWAALATRPATRRHAWVVGVLATAATLVAALYGGLVAHG